MCVCVLADARERPPNGSPMVVFHVLLTSSRSILFLFMASLSISLPFICFSTTPTHTPLCSTIVFVRTQIFSFVFVWLILSLCCCVFSCCFAFCVRLSTPLASCEVVVHGRFSFPSHAPGTIKILALHARLSSSFSVLSISVSDSLVYSVCDRFSVVPGSLLPSFYLVLRLGCSSFYRLRV